MSLSKAFIHLDAALRFPDRRWQQQMKNLPLPPPDPGQRRPSSQLDGPWAAVIAGPCCSGKTTLYHSRLARLWPGVSFTESHEVACRQVQAHQDFIWETGVLDASGLSSLNSWSLTGYKVGLVVLCPSHLRIHAPSCPMSGYSPSLALHDQLAELALMLRAARSRVHAIWQLDSSPAHAPPCVQGRWVQGVPAPEIIFPGFE